MKNNKYDACAKKAARGGSKSLGSQRGMPYFVTARDSISDTRWGTARRDNNDRGLCNEGNRDYPDFLRASGGPECYLWGSSGHITKYCEGR